MYSVDIVGKFKPHQSTCQKVLNYYMLASYEIIMVAAHGWDILGAGKVGLKTAFIEKEGKKEYTLAKFC